MQTFINILVIILFIDRFIIHFENVTIVSINNKNEQTDKNGNSTTDKERNDDK